METAFAGLRRGRKPASSQAGARKIHDIGNQASHAGGADLHLAENPPALRAGRILAEKAHAPLNGGKRVTQVVAKDGDELFAQF
nr:hypothetical protein [Caulobacter sp.]